MFDPKAIDKDGENGEIKHYWIHPFIFRWDCIWIKDPPPKKPNMFAWNILTNLFLQ